MLLPPDHTLLEVHALCSLLVAGRLLPLAIAAPWLSRNLVPLPASVGVVAALSVALGPAAAAQAELLTVDALFVGLVVREFVVGLVFAVVASLPLLAFRWAGDLVDRWRGAFATDASVFGEPATPMAGLYRLSALVAFFGVGGHRITLDAFAQTVLWLPPGSAVAASWSDLAWGGVRLTGAALYLAVAIALPVGVMMIVFESITALMSRLANPFPSHFLASPVRPVAGLVTAMLVLVFVLPALPEFIQDAVASALVATREGFSAAQ